ncbi:Rieske (2Fe-2S) protein [Rhodopila sp.]|jgi:3-phenylpropionate/trans-cinnamate dioxygenase ferredoxin subunit|uniref:Rieske (2Fe-2S) protein n=1 Tax=Rhodopila sp. TaxID=2480087 RepID=UPI002B817454|nr:Rieske (2Fe-2S) protein [Rhodopila sp.]HVZ09585.1 Rieske (2Fe-2S) protein [Rhodopila sp.]
MPRHVVAKVEEIPAGTCKIVTVRGREIGIFNVNETFYGLINRCPHQGAPLCEGAIVSRLVSHLPGEYGLSRPGEMIRCPWHCWEFDITTGKSLCDPNSMQARMFNVAVEPGQDLVEGPFVAESVDVSVEDRYVVVTM